MNVSRWAVVIIGCFLFFGVGFVAGGYVEAGGIAPGSAGDPLAAKSYVTKAVGEKISKLQSQADALQAKINSLQQTVAKLQQEVDSNAAVNTNTSEQIPKQPSGQITPSKETLKPSEKISSDTIPTGKTATVIAQSANVRKGPGASYPKVSGLTKGKSVAVLIIQSGWVNVDLGGNVKGWISKDLVEIK